MNQRNENNTENITWAPRLVPRQLVFENNQDQLQNRMPNNQLYLNYFQNNIILNNNFDRELNMFFIEILERRRIIDNRQENNITLYSQQKHPNNIKNNNQ